MSSPHPDLGWVPSVFSEWPGPIAHEYHRLADLLSQSHAATNQPNYRILGAFLQMRDFAEVLIKLPTIVMIRDGDRLRLDMREIKGLLLGTPPSLGGWLEAARRAAKTLRACTDTIWTRDLVAIFLDDKGKPSSFAHLLEKVVQWRNSELGHGALRMDLDGLTNELQELVKEMNSRLATVAMRKPWNNLQIQLDGSRTPLVGFECIRRQHEGDPESGHTDREMALMCKCSGKENILNLAPYAAARTCTKCNKRDVFFFNGLSGRSPNRKAQYLDYMMGHSLLPVLGNDRRWTDECADLGGLRARGAIGAKRIDENLLALLERIDLSRDYVAPTYMAEELQEFLASHDRGIVWLRAPAHTGKTVFAGHAKSLLADDPGDLMISTFFIKREYRFGLGMFNAFIDDAFYRGMPSQYHRRFQWDERGDGSMSDCFVAEAAALLERAREMSIANDRVLIILDGMDELPAPGAYGELSDTDSIADLLPPADRLPAGVYLLLTSRPDSPDETPEWVLDRMRAATSGQNHSRIIDIQRGTEGYRRLLRRCFDEQRSKSTWKSGRVHFPDALFHAIGDRSDWTFLYFSLLLRLLRDGVITPDDLERMEERGERLLFAHIGRLEAVLGEKEFDRVRELLLVLAACEEAHAQAAAIVPPAFFDCDWRGVPLDELAGLLHEPYFDAGTEIKNRPGSVPLRLLFLLRSAEDLLRSHRADDSHAAYRIGLKGLVAAMRADRSHCGWAARLDETHLRLVRDAIEAERAFAEPNDSENDSPPHEVYLWYRGWLHARALTNLGSAQIQGDAAESLRNYLLPDEVNINAAEVFVEGWSPRDACELLSITIDCLRWRMNSVDSPHRDECTESLARALSTRASVRGDYHDDNGAEIDYEESIRISQQAILDGGRKAPRGIRHGLALSLMNRGVHRANLGDLDEAALDFELAVRLFTQLQHGVDVALRRQLNEGFAAALENRGFLRFDDGDIEGASSDYDRAIEIMREMRKSRKERWDPDLCCSLASALTKRGMVRESREAWSEANRDHKEAISLLTQYLAKHGAEESNTAWVRLAEAYGQRWGLTNRGTIPQKTLVDAGKAIAMFDALLEAYGDDCPSNALEQLATLYRRRGEHRADARHYRRALSDFSNSIKVYRRLQLQLGMRWSSELSESLAEVYYLRADMKKTIKDVGGCREDRRLADEAYDIAIKLLMLSPAQTAVSQSITMPIGLARILSNRANARLLHDDSDGCLDDADRAVEIIEALMAGKAIASRRHRVQLYKVIEVAFFTRANLHEESDDLKSAVSDGTRGILFMKIIGKSLGRYWTHEMKLALAEGYRGRAALHAKLGMEPEALSDRRRADKFVK